MIKECTRPGWLVGLCCAAFVITTGSPSIRESEAATQPPLTTSKGIVAADNVEASEVGAGVLRAGGNAVDAAIATALALGVVHPASSGIGGGGFAVVYIASEKRFYAFDFREVGPSQIKPELFYDKGVLVKERSRRTGLAVGVPGEVAGLWTLSKRFGKRSWSQVVDPAAELAQRGFATSRFLADASKYTVPSLGVNSRLRRALMPNGKVLSEGQRVRRLGLAKTLRRIAKHGRDGFYKGPVAKEVIKTVQQTGGVMTESDLAGYKVVERAPLTTNWRGRTVVTMPLPSSGGIALLMVLGMLDASKVDLAALGHGSSAATHITTEFLKHAFADRSRFLGDGQPASLVQALLKPNRLRRLAKRVGRRVLKSRLYGDRRLGMPSQQPADSGTSHLCVVDENGNAVALTTTVNTYFGSKLLTETTGVVLNDEVDDFSMGTGKANAFGLVQSSFNLVGPGKRPLSSMTPTLVLDDGGVVACAGGSGGPRIISNTIQSLINALVFDKDAEASVSLPRVHHQWLPDRLIVEPEMVEDVRVGLRRRGHNVVESGAPTGVQMILVDKDGTRSAASDPRKGGAPAAQ